MPMLHPCPRCTQALPASAKFCRRCGAAAGAMASAVPVQPQARTKPGSLFTAGLTAMVLAAGVVGGFFFLGSQVTAPTTAVPMQVIPPAPTYVVPGNPPARVIVVPGYQTPEGHDRPNRDSWDRRERR